MRKKKLLKRVLAGVVSCSIAITSIFAISDAVNVSAQYYDDSELSQIEYDGTNIKSITSSKSYVKLIIKEGTEKIEDNTFKNCKKVVKVVLPDGLKSIGANAFYDCRLQSVSFPKSLRSVEKNSFADSIEVDWKGKTYESFSDFYSYFSKLKEQPDKPSKITTLELKKIGLDRVDVSWKKVINATGYELLYSNDSKLNNAKTIKTSSTSRSIYSLKKNTKYYFKVRAYNENCFDSENTAYGDYSSISKVDTSTKKIRDKMIAKYKKMIKKGKYKYFMVTDFTCDGFPDLFVGKSASEASALYMYPMKMNGTLSNNPSNVFRWEAYDEAQKLAVDLKKHTIATYCHWDKDEGDYRAGDSYIIDYYKGTKYAEAKTSEAYAHWYTKKVYSSEIDGKYKKINKNKFNKGAAKVKSRLKLKAFMVENTARNRAKYCK